MVNLVIWILWLTVLLVIAHYISNDILLTPEIGFIACFIPQAIYAIFYVDRWNLDFSGKTMFILFSSTAFFLLFSILIRYFRNNIKCFHSLQVNKKGNDDYTANNYPSIFVEHWKLNFMLIFQVIVFILLIRYVNSMPGSSFSEKLAYINYTNKFVEDGLADAGLGMSSLLSNARLFSYSYGFVAIYLYIHSIIYKYNKNRVVLLLCYFVSIISSLLTGGRFNAIALLISTFVQIYFVYGISKNWKNKLSTKSFFKIFLISIIVILFFQQAGNILGRNSTRNFSDYMSVYLSAQLKNIDTYVRAGKFGCDISNWQTLYSFVNFIANHFGVSDWKHFYDQPFYYINGLNLGNVSTVFYWFLHDGGFLALYIFTGGMVLISQFFFHKAIKVKKRNVIDYAVIIYSYCFYGIVFSFYSNRFYSAIISVNGIKFFIFLVFINIFFTKVKIRFGKATHSNVITVK